MNIATITRPVVVQPLLLCLAYRGIGKVSRLIRRWTWFLYSHIAGANNATSEVVEAWHKRSKESGKKWWQGEVRKTANYHEGHAPGTRIDVFSIPSASLEQQERAWDGMCEEEGADYDLSGIWGFMVRKARQSQKKWFCSELFFAKCIDVLIGLLCRIAPHKVSPGILITSPLLRYEGFLIVGEDEGLLDVVSMLEIARRNEAQVDE